LSLLIATSIIIIVIVPVDDTTWKNKLSIQKLNWAGRSRKRFHGFCGFLIKIYIHLSHLSA